MSFPSASDGWGTIQAVEIVWIDNVSESALNDTWLRLIGLDEPQAVERSHDWQREGF